jgi:MFS family permease
LAGADAELGAGADRRLLALVLALLGNGAMLSLVGQRAAASGGSATAWTAGYVMAAQLTMIPVALWGGTWAERHGGRPLMLAACAALGARALLAARIIDLLWLLPVQVLDGIASGLIGVAVPVAVADASWGSGRTQTALGAVYSVQGLGGQLSHVVGGTLVAWIGWPAAFLALALPVGGALLLSLALAGASGKVPKGRAAESSPPDGGGRATGSKPRHVRAISPAPAETAPRRVSPCRTLMPPPWATISRP